jgi:hypothetical protein
MTMSAATTPELLGSFWCDQCTDAMRRPVWILDGVSRLCRDHYRQITGIDPHTAQVVPDELLPAADAAWTRLVPGLRMRPLEGGPGVELQGVRNVQLDSGPRTVSDAPAWRLNDANLVELVLMASAHRNDAEPNKALVRMALLRILHGAERP